MHRPYSSPYTSPCPSPLRTFSMDAYPSRRFCSATGGHQLFLYLTRVPSTSPYIPNPNPAQRLRLLQASVSVSHVNNRTHLASRRRIISPIPTGRTPGAFYRGKRWHAIIDCMAARGAGGRGGGYYIATLPIGIYPAIGILTLSRINCTCL